MENLPSQYDGTIQPEVWVQGLHFFCALWGIHDKTTVLTGQNQFYRVPDN
ncbi:hypothetical protein RhiirB3_436612 [Rhizophagus irregularis]|nr:hypothetical protein RhiirB3_436612 [Rhizophagus irregularis]